MSATQKFVICLEKQSLKHLHTNKSFALQMAFSRLYEAERLAFLLLDFLLIFNKSRQHKCKPLLLAETNLLDQYELPVNKFGRSLDDIVKDL